MGDDFTPHREHLLRVAYRMLGSLADAEDAVQETWLRWQRADRSDIVDPRAWLTRVVGRICLDVLRSARVTREAYVGPWLPEPLVERLPADASALSAGADPADVAVLDDSVRIALLHLLERLTPEQRVAFVLHDVFGIPFDGIASTLGTKVETARQLASRARRLLHDSAPSPLAPLPEQRATVEAFLEACQGGDLTRLTALLAPDVEFHSDGGGRVRAALHPIVGAEKVVRFLLGILQKGGARVVPEPALVNGQYGIVFRFRPGDPNEGEVMGVGVPDVTPEGLITRFSYVANPEKLHSVPAVDGRSEVS
ncbi:sigma-70 family RNA polymerase sigma factor [Cryptosporangium aurantiacum]|uniref:RNA polymerase, sigma subunit, ECF family n=1 Tax=Cryptosporangium aurantiacum TaxID=134849 RepID=A0A1M7RHJ9_9ACTN|nr:sigma-70 family RNA polymerase sigma factor [Cryptosporangium aurantiacum]SHN45727.1 RNA polymerase, sigma subunit, ECF family [Cryptosporangium aurantiacum]